MKFINEYIGIWAATNAVELLVILILAYTLRNKIFRFFGGGFISQQTDNDRVQDIRMDNLERVQKERENNYKKINEIDHLKKDYDNMNIRMGNIEGEHKELDSKMDKLNTTMTRIEK